MKVKRRLLDHSGHDVDPGLRRNDEKNWIAKVTLECPRC